MSAPTVGRPVAGFDDDQPTDRFVDRRSFLTRMSVLAAVGASSVALPAVAHAAPAPTVSAVPGTVRTEALDDITELTIAEAATLIRRGRLAPERLVEAYLDRIGAFDDTYQAWNRVLADAALARARSLGTPPRNAPLLHGVPLAIKDNYYTAGIETSVNSFAFEGFVPEFDATAVAKLLAAGAVVLGKTQMGPLATTRATTRPASSPPSTRGRRTTRRPTRAARRPAPRRPWPAAWRPPASAPRPAARSPHRPTPRT